MKHKYKNGDQVWIKAMVIGEVDGYGAIDIEYPDGRHDYYKTKSLELAHELIPAPEFVTGDEVEVSDTGISWKKRIYMFSAKGNHYCIHLDYNEKYHNGDVINSHILCWAQIRAIKASEIEITAKVNGKEVKLSDISLETLKAIREAE